MSTEIVELVREARHGRGLSQQTLASLVGTSQSAISAYESGRQRPSTATLVRILDACGFDLRLHPNGKQVSLAATVGRLVAAGDFDDEAFALRWLLNEFGRNVWEALTPPERDVALRTEPQSSGSRRWDVFIACLGQHLAESSAIAAPAWVDSADRRKLDEMWFPGRGGDHEVAQQLVDLDPAETFVRRGVGLDAASLGQVGAPA